MLVKYSIIKHFWKISLLHLLPKCLNEATVAEGWALFPSVVNDDGGEKCLEIC